MAMKKITALTNVGSAKWRMLRKGRSIDMDEGEIDEGVLRLWRSKAIKIDDKMYEEPISSDGTTEAVPKKPEVESRPSDADGSDPDKGEDGDKEKNEVDKELEENKDDKQDEQEVISRDGIPDLVKEEDASDHPSKGPEDTEDNAPESDAGENDPQDDQAKVEQVPFCQGDEEGRPDEAMEYIANQPAGFFDKNNLDTMNLNELKIIGEKVGVEVKSRKKGVSMIADKVERIMSA